MIRTAIPPTTPPAMAPTGVLDEPLLAAAAEAEADPLEEAGTVVTEKTVEREGAAEETDEEEEEEELEEEELLELVLEVLEVVCRRSKGQRRNWLLLQFKAHGGGASGCSGRGRSG